MSSRKNRSARSSSCRAPSPTIASGFCRIASSCGNIPGGNSTLAVVLPAVWETRRTPRRDRLPRAFVVASARAVARCAADRSGGTICSRAFHFVPPASVDRTHVVRRVIEVARVHRTHAAVGAVGGEERAAAASADAASSSRRRRCPADSRAVLTPTQPHRALHARIAPSDSSSAVRRGIQRSRHRGARCRALPTPRCSAAAECSGDRGIRACCARRSISSSTISWLASRALGWLCSVSGAGLKPVATDQRRHALAQEGLDQREQSRRH